MDALLSRALTVPTDDEKKEREVGLVKEMLAENSYRQPFIKQQLSRLRKKQENTRTQQNPDGQAQDDPKVCVFNNYRRSLFGWPYSSHTKGTQTARDQGGWTSATVGLVAATEFKGQG